MLNVGFGELIAILAITVGLIVAVAVIARWSDRR
jgi:hypothetical protein